ncbi:MAG TPA: sigma-70 family RNA polymerase sigma factor [Gammaproteobacteria bacterium]|nr:sigma-70 family RNA polymerase sigma factor [Gammaproteobacteria bacterium]
MSDAPERWLQIHGDALYRYALRLTRDTLRAEEAVQETLLAAWAARDRRQADATVRTWLIAILKHKVADQFRRDAREPVLDISALADAADPADADAFDATGHWREAPADWGDPESALQQEQFLHALQRCLDRLPGPMRDVFVLREVLEEDTEIICKELAVTPTNVWTTLHRARSRLRQCLDRTWGGRATSG